MDSLLLRLRVSLCAFPFATAWPVNAELAAPSVSEPSFGAIRSRYPAFRLALAHKRAEAALLVDAYKRMSLKAMAEP